MLTSMPDSSFTELTDSAYTQLRRNLLRFKGSDQQRDFLTIVRDSATFLEHFSQSSEDWDHRSPARSLTR